MANTAPVAGALKMAATPAPGSRHQQGPAIGRGEDPRELPLQVRAECRPQVQRRPFEPHRHAGADRGDGTEQAGDEWAGREVVPGVVEGVEVLVGRRRADTTAPDMTSDGVGRRQPDGRKHGDDPRLELEEVIEHHVDHQPVEDGHEQPGDGAGDGRPHHHLVRAHGQVPEFGAAVGGDPPARHPHAGHPPKRARTAGLVTNGGSWSPIWGPSVEPPSTVTVMPVM